MSAQSSPSPRSSRGRPSLESGEFQTALLHPARSAFHQNCLLLLIDTWEELDSARLRPPTSSRVEAEVGRATARGVGSRGDQRGWTVAGRSTWRVTPAHPGGGPSFAREVAADRGHFAFPLASVVLQSCSKDRTRRHVLLFDDSLGSEENDFTTGSLSRRRECGPRAARRTAFLPVYRSTARKELPLTCQITPTGPRSDPARRHANQRQRPGRKNQWKTWCPPIPAPPGSRLAPGGRLNDLRRLRLSSLAEHRPP